MDNRLKFLYYDITETVGTQKESTTLEWKTGAKRGRSAIGKSVAQSEDVMGSELKVAKCVSLLPRKAAIVYIIPVP